MLLGAQGLTALSRERDFPVGLLRIPPFSKQGDTDAKVAGGAGKVAAGLGELDGISFEFSGMDFCGWS